MSDNIANKHNRSGSASEGCTKRQRRGYNFRGIGFLIIAGACLTSLLLYWSGLNGPLLFDDYGNLAPVDRWLRGETHLLAALLPNSSSVINSRPVAMASFMFTGWLQPGTFTLKAGNLVLHLACGIVGWRVLRLALLSDTKLRPHAEWTSALLAAVWLVHPLQVSTVLYGVQRMAQLSALFALLAVWTYQVAISRASQGLPIASKAALFVLFPLLGLVGLLSKQNAVVAPLICLVLHLCYTPSARWSRPISAFYTLFIAVPTILILVLLTTSPQHVLGGYEELEFSLTERLLTQPRVLLDYLGMWFVPRTPEMGLYTDGYPVSTALFEPADTALALVALLTISAIAFCMRRKAPSAAAGWFFFLAAHSVEAGFLPLEMYYEHRNYLPSFGLLLALAGAVGAVAAWNRVHVQQRVLATLGLLAALVLCYSTLGRVLVWTDEFVMAQQGLRHHPESLRVRQDWVTLMLRSGNPAGAVPVINSMLQSNSPRMRLIARIDQAAISCARGEAPNVALLKSGLADAQERLTVHEVHAAHLLEGATRLPVCERALPMAAADVLSTLIDAADGQSQHTANKGLMRRIAGQLYARAGRWDLALRLAEEAWQGEQTLPVGSLLVRAQARNGRPAQGRAILSQMGELQGADEQAWRRELSALEVILSSTPSTLAPE